MTTTDGRTAKQPYRVRVGNTWYWVDPTVPSATIEPGDTVILFPVSGEATLAILRSSFSDSAVAIDFTTLEGDRFSVASGDLAALHLAAVDEVQ